MERSKNWSCAASPRVMKRNPGVSWHPYLCRFVAYWLCAELKLQNGHTSGRFVDSGMSTSEFVLVNEKSSYREHEYTRWPTKVAYSYRRLSYLPPKEIVPKDDTSAAYFLREFPGTLTNSASVSRSPCISRALAQLDTWYPLPYQLHVTKVDRWDLCGLYGWRHLSQEPYTHPYRLFASQCPWKYPFYWQQVCPCPGLSFTLSNILFTAPNYA